MEPSPRAIFPTRRRRAMAAVAAATASVAGVGGLAYALTSGGVSASPAAAVSPSGSTGASVLAAGGATDQAGRRRGLRGLVRRAVHVDIVVPKAGGGFRTVDIDRGTVTGLSSTSITVTPPGGRAPVTAAITSATREPKGAPTMSEQVVLVSSGGDALAIRPVRSSAASTAPPAGNSGAGAPGASGTASGTSSAAGSSTASFA